MMVTSVDEGVAGVQEFFDGMASSRTFEYESPRPAVEVPPTEARFKAGDKVVARRDVATMHTRLAGYVRGRPGVVDSVNRTTAFARRESCRHDTARADIRRAVSHVGSLA